MWIGAAQSREQQRRICWKNNGELGGEAGWGEAGWEESFVSRQCWARGTGKNNDECVRVFSKYATSGNTFLSRTVPSNKDCCYT